MAETFDPVVKLAATGSLSEALTAARRLAMQLNDEELANWVRLELLGYDKDNPAVGAGTKVPDYRTIHGIWFNVFGQAMVLDDRLAFLNETRIPNGVPDLETLATTDGQLEIGIPGASEIFRTKLNVQVSGFRVTPQSIAPVLSSIRAQLLDRLTEAEQQHRLDDAGVHVEGTALESPDRRAPGSGAIARIFLVHGHDSELRHEVQEFLRKLGLETVVLADRPNAGATIIEKFEREAVGATYVIVLLTPDDVTVTPSTSEVERARQNVIFELGLLCRAPWTTQCGSD